MIFQDNCKCGISIPRGRGYYSSGRKLRCLGCGKINQKEVRVIGGKGK